MESLIARSDKRGFPHGFEYAETERACTVQVRARPAGRGRGRDKLRRRVPAVDLAPSARHRKPNRSPLQSFLNELH